MSELPPEDDWFGEPAPEPPPRPRRLPLPTRLPRAGPARRPGGRRALTRLALAVLALVVLAGAIGSLVAGDSRAAADRSFLARLAGPAGDSQAVGRALVGLLTQPRLTPSTLERTLAALLARQSRDAAAVAALGPSPTLRTLYPRAVEALRLRVSGLAGLRSGFRQAEASPKKAAWPSLLAAQADRLTASDVVWQDLFQAPATAQLARDGAHGTTVPASLFVADPAVATAAAMSRVLARLRGVPAATAAATVLKLGATGPAVRAWQQALDRWLARQPGATRVAVVGQFGPATVAATMLFQRSAGLAVDGEVGARTRAALARALGSRAG